MIELIEKLMAADHIWQSDKAYIEATEAFKIIRQHQAEQCIQTPPDCINSQGDVNKPGDQGCEISDVEKAALDVVIEYDRISEYDPDPLARNLATTRGTGAAVCYWAVQKALRETKPVSSGDAGSEDARAFLSSRNNALSMPAGSNPRTSRAPTEESSNHNGLGRAKGSEMANSAPPTDQPDQYMGYQSFTPEQKLAYDVGYGHGCTDTKLERESPQPVELPGEWEDVHLRVRKDDQYKGPGHSCISYRGIIYKPERELWSDEKTLAAELKAILAINNSSLEAMVKAMMPTIHHYLWEARQEAEWQPIETAPKNGIGLLASDEDGKMAVACWDGSVEAWLWYETDGRYSTIDATHWRPLPQPPENTRRGSDD